MDCPDKTQVFGVAATWAASSVLFALGLCVSVCRSGSFGAPRTRVYRRRFGLCTFSIALALLAGMYFYIGATSSPSTHSTAHPNQNDADDDDDSGSGEACPSMGALLLYLALPVLFAALVVTLLGSWLIGRCCCVSVALAERAPLIINDQLFRYPAGYEAPPPYTVTAEPTITHTAPLANSQQPPHYSTL
eukprot:m.66247 g.66247  ORF g.66247 m.66247 type:complete len:190 (+) comp49865_c0_seq2:2-571(+)